MTDSKKKATRKPRSRKGSTRSRQTGRRAPEPEEVVPEPEPAKAVEPVRTPEPPAPKPTPPKPPIRMVELRNLMGQMLIASVIDDGGVARDIRLMPRATHGPVPEANLTGHTRRLASIGHLKITPTI